MYSVSLVISGFESFILSSTHSGTVIISGSPMQVKTLADSLFVLCKLAYFDAVTTEQLLIISPLNFLCHIEIPVELV